MPKAAPPPSPPRLNPKQQRFIDEYLVDGNATQAAIRAGYSKKTAKEQGHQLFTKLHALIAPRLKAQQDKLSETCGITRERWLLELKRMAFYDPRKLYDALGNPIEIPALGDNEAAAIVGFEFAEDYLGAKDKDGGEQRVACGYTKKFKLADKLKALELFGKATGYYVEKKELLGHMTLSELLDAADQA